MAKHYNITLTKTAQKQLDKLTDNIANPILSAIATLSTNPRPIYNATLIAIRSCDI